MFYLFKIERCDAINLLSKHGTFEDAGRFADEDYNDVLKKILDADSKTTKKKEM